MILDKELLFVPLPVAAKLLGSGYSPQTNTLYYQANNENLAKKLPPGNFELIGLIPGMGESEAGKCVEGIMVDRYGERLTPLESLYSRMEAAGVYLANPLGKEPQDVTLLTEMEQNILGEEIITESKRKYEQWHTAQSRTSSTWVVVRDRGYK